MYSFVGLYANWVMLLATVIFLHYGTCPSENLTVKGLSIKHYVMVQCNFVVNKCYIQLKVVNFVCICYVYKLIKMALYIMQIKAVSFISSCICNHFCTSQFDCDHVVCTWFTKSTYN